MPTKEYMERQERELAALRNPANHIQYHLTYIDVDGAVRQKTITMIKGIGDHFVSIRHYAESQGWGLIDIS